MSSLKRKNFRKIVHSLVNAHMTSNPNFLFTPTEQQELIIKSACDVATMIIQHTKTYRRNPDQSNRSEPIEIIPFLAEDTGQM